MEKNNIKYGSTIVEAVDEINDKKAKGQSVHPLTEEGLKAIEVANMIVGTIMKRNKPDLGFFKLYMSNTKNRLKIMTANPEKTKQQERLSQKGSLKRRRSDRKTD